MGTDEQTHCRSNLKKDGVGSVEHFALLKTCQSSWFNTTLEVIMEDLGKRKTVWNVCGFLTFFFFSILCLVYNRQLSLSKISCYSSSVHSTERYLLLLKKIKPKSSNRKVVSVRNMESKRKLTNGILRTISLSQFNRIAACFKR